MRRETALNEHPIFAELNGGQRQIKIGLPLAERTETIVTDHLASYGAALKQLGAIGNRSIGRWLNNRAENSRQPFRRRERAMLRFRRMGSLQKFAAGHRQVHNHFNQERTLISRRNFAPRTFGSRIDAPLRWPHGASFARPEQGRVGAISETVLIRLTAPAAGRNAGAAAQATKPLSD